MKAQNVVIIAFEGVHSLDVSGPWEVFATANEKSGKPIYRPLLLSTNNLRIRSASGLGLIADEVAASFRRTIDTLLIAGGPGAVAASRSPESVRKIKSLAMRSRRVGSICTGAFALAATGLLDGSRVVTHWAHCDDLEERFPNLEVDRNAIFAQVGNRFTSAGVTSGIDMSLEMIRQDVGHEVAAAVARELVVYLRRPGGQSQFSIAARLDAAATDELADLQGWINESLSEDLRVEKLAERVGMSPRTFARVFTREVGLTPAAFVRSMRIERAKSMLEATKMSLDEIATSCGFGTTLSFRRLFQKEVGVLPSDYRSRCD